MQTKLPFSVCALVPTGHAQSVCVRVILKYGLNGSNRYFLHFFIFPFSSLCCTSAPYWNALTLPGSSSAPSFIFHTINLLPWGMLSRLPLNIYTPCIFPWQENANLLSTRNCFHPISQMQINSSGEGQPHSRLFKPSLLKIEWCCSKYRSAAVQRTLTLIKQYGTCYVQLQFINVHSNCIKSWFDVCLKRLYLHRTYICV